MSLKEYNRKRKFSETPEPKGKAKPTRKGLPRFVVQLHRATRLHHDFRLEFDGVFKSWAVPRGPSLNPLDQRLAVFVEDHPLDYGSFEGIIPKGNYGAGTVMIWDTGTYVERTSEGRAQTEAKMREGFEKGHMTFLLDGEKLKGEFALIKLKKDKGGKAWLLVKKRDEHASFKRTAIPDDLSVTSGRTMEQIAAESAEAGDVWLPKQGRQGPSKAKKVAKASAPKSKLAAKKNAPPKRSRSITERSGSAIVEPMPRKLKPMVATVSRTSVSGEDWLFEPSLGGLRAVAEVDGKSVHLYSKSGLPFEKKFPEIVDELRALGLKAVLDGEIVKGARSATFFLYDCLYFAGRDLRKEPLRIRKESLERAMVEGKHVKLVQSADGNPEKSRKKLREGALVAKNLESTYRSGTTADWLIVPFDAPQAKTITKPARAINPPSTPHKKLKGPSPSSRSSTARPPATLGDVRLTNLNKIYWPDEGITKGDLLEYYKSVATFILPYLKDRPESLNRQPNGIAAPGFYQKDMTGHIPRWLKTTRLFSESSEKSIDYVLCQDLRSLLYIVNLGCIEINPWFSRVEHLDKPDFLVIDLDPDNNDFNDVIKIAHEVHSLLESVGARSYCKTSGATGIHIGVPTGARYEFDTVRDFAEMVCRVVAKKYPALTSIERNPARRRKKIYLDFMQNRRSQTLASVYCVRPKSGAPVSMPLSWKELRPGIKPEQFNIQNAASRIRAKGDLWAPVLGSAIDLLKCMKALERKFRLA